MDVCKEQLWNLLSQDPKKWSGIIWVSLPTIEKLLSGKGSVRLETAKKILQSVNEHAGVSWNIEDAFDTSKLKNLEKDRSNVVYEYGAAPLSENDKAWLIRFLIEGKFDGFSIRDVLLLLLTLGAIGFIVSLAALLF